MSIEKDLKDLKIIRRTIDVLHINLKSLKTEKDLLEGELSIASEDEAKKLQNKLDEVDKEMEEIKENLRINKRNAEVLKIITSSVAPEKEGVQSVREHTPTRDEVSQIIGNKDEVSAIINSLPNKQSGNRTQSVAPQARNSKPKRYTSRGIMKAKINALKNIAVNKLKSLMSHIKSSIKKVNGAKRLRSAKRIEAKRLRNLEEKPKLRGPKLGEPMKYSAKPGTKNKINKLALLGATIIATLMVCGAVSLDEIRNSEKINDNIYGETTRVTSEYLAEMENNLKLKEEELQAIDLSQVDNNSEPTQNNSNINSKTDIDNNITKLNQSSSNKQKISNNTKLNKNNSNNSKPRTKPDQSKNSTKLNQSNTKPDDNKNEIEKVYGGEISASENGILTEEDILYAATQMGWSEGIIENIKEMMPGILDMQRDFDVSPLVFLAIAQAESGCGTAYQPGGSDYARDNDYRAVNIEFYTGQIGVVAFSNTNYGIHAKWSDVPYDFGNYLRNGPPYTETPALTMKDLKEHGKYTAIFNSADTQGTAIYNQLKACLEKRVDKADILKAVEECTTSEITKMTGTIKSNIKEKSVDQEMSER